jgi:hypothetical protein
MIIPVTMSSFVGLAIYAKQLPSSLVMVSMAVGVVGAKEGNHFSVSITEAAEPGPEKFVVDHYQYGGEM